MPTLKTHDGLRFAKVNLRGIMANKRTFVGVNASFKDFINIGSDVFVTMGANITKDIPNNSTVTSTDLFESDNIVNKKLKRKYFNI